MTHMINLKTMPKDTVAELLRYIAEHEDLSSVEKLASEDLSPESAKATLREVADELAREAAAENRSTYDVKGCKVLSKEAKTIISCLSPREEKSLLTTFGLIDPSTMLPPLPSRRAGGAGEKKL